MQEQNTPLQVFSTRLPLELQVHILRFFTPSSPERIRAILLAYRASMRADGANEEQIDSSSEQLAQVLWANFIKGQYAEGTSLDSVVTRKYVLN